MGKLARVLHRLHSACPTASAAAEPSVGMKKSGGHRGMNRSREEVPCLDAGTAGVLTTLALFCLAIGRQTFGDRRPSKIRTRWRFRPNFEWANAPKATLPSTRNVGGASHSPKNAKATENEPVRAMRLSDEFIAKVDAWVADQTDLPGRSEAIRRLVELELKMTGMIEWLAYLLLIRSRSLLFEGQMPARDRKCFNEDTGWSLLRRGCVLHRRLPAEFQSEINS